ERALGPIASALGRSTEATALAVVQIANNNMVGLLRSVLTERGLDPRDFTLLAYGGAGPLHVGDLMRDFEVADGIVPNHPGPFSAFGFIMCDARVDRHRPVQTESPPFEGMPVTRLIAKL